MNVKKQKGNMYSWITATWNPVSGRCSFDCRYCYMKKWNLGDINFKDHDYYKDIGAIREITKENENPVIFVGSGIDLFNPDVKDHMIMYILETILNMPWITFLIQTKNTERLNSFALPDNVILATTAETDMDEEYNLSNAPSVFDRLLYLKRLHEKGYRTMVTIEPVVRFKDFYSFAGIILASKPIQINIGANSNSKVILSEPSREELTELINILKKKTEVYLKPNLKRLL